jgi:hypothetical protein
MARATKDRDSPAEERDERDGALSPRAARPEADDAWEYDEILEDESGEPLLRFPLHPQRHRRLPFAARVAVFIVGWVLILIGIAGLVLPGIQGVFTIVLGAALLSLDNELMYRGLRKVFKRWPKLWHMVEHFRAKAHDRVHRMFHRPK